MKKTGNRKPETRIIYFLFLMLIILYVACGDESSIQSGKSSTDNEPDQILIKPHIFISENGMTSAILESNVVKIYEYEGYSYASLEDSIVISFFNKEGKHTTTLTAHYGEIWGLYENTDSLRVQGNVLLVSEERNASLKTESLHWIASISKVFADGLVTINSEDGYEQGTGFKASDDLSEYEFTGPVSGKIREEGFKLPDR